VEEVNRQVPLESLKVVVASPLHLPKKSQDLTQLDLKKLLRLSKLNAIHGQVQHPLQKRKLLLKKEVVVV
jgi:hypothetical protein